MPFQSFIYNLIILIRAKQWVKNSFVLAPLVFTGQFTELNSIIQILIALGLFCIASSSIYIFNDILDIQADKLHPIKSKTRPLAAGLISVTTAKIILLFLLLILIASHHVLPKVSLVILVYLLLNIAYCIWLKNQPIWDILSISFSFVLRVYAGSVALDVATSHWMLVTTLSLALFLASIKRRQEIVLAPHSARKSLAFYSVALLDIYAQIALTASLIFYSMFVMTIRPEMVWTIPCFIFGFLRYWLIVHHHNSGESPTDALLKDWQLLANIFVWMIITIVSIQFY